MFETAMMAAETHSASPRFALFDEEMIDTETESHLLRLRDRAITGGARFDWVTAIQRNNLAIDTDTGSWFSWDPAFEDIWIRKKPDFARDDYPGGITIESTDKAFWDQAEMNKEVARSMLPRTCCFALGIRAAESQARSLVAESSNFISGIKGAYSDQNFAVLRPVIDWTTEELWSIIKWLKWDYSKWYYNAWRAGAKAQDLRVGPLMAVEQTLKLAVSRKCDPDYFYRVAKRLPDAMTSLRFSHSVALGRGRTKSDIKLNRDWLRKSFEDAPEAKKKFTDTSVKTIIRTSIITGAHVPESSLVKMAMVGESKGKRRQITTTTANARKQFAKGNLKKFDSKSLRMAAYLQNESKKKRRQKNAKSD